MNIIYILIPVVVLSLVALIIIRPKLLVLNKSHTRYLNPAKPALKYGTQKADKTKVRFVMHPPILNDNL